MNTGKTIALNLQFLVGKVISLFFNTLSSFVIAILPRSKSLLISWLQSPSTVILEPKKLKSITVSIVSPSICYEEMGLKAMILVFWMLNFKPVFFTLLSFTLLSLTFIKRLFSSSLLSAIRVVSSVYLRLLMFLLAILMSSCASSRGDMCSEQRQKLFNWFNWHQSLSFSYQLLSSKLLPTYACLTLPRL